MSRREALTRATDQLAANPDLRPTALPDAALLLMHLLRVDRAALIAHPETPMDREEQANYQRLIERRLRFEPIQYITGEQEFYGLALSVSPAVLIPRPETELLVETVIKYAQNGRLRIVDVGTGSGAIAIALAHRLPDAAMTAVDLSPEALALAQQNARRHGVSIRFLQSDLLLALAQEETYDIVVSNPPYIPERDSPTLHPQVREHEPALALFAGTDGLSIYERLIPQARALLKPDGLLALELGYGQQPALAMLLQDWRDVTFHSDLQQIPRVVTAHR